MRVLTFFLIIMYIPPVYRTTYRIVQEKDSKVKESMRMMGLQDFAYWSSWYSYYTMINTAISLISWAILYFLVFSKTAWWLILAMLWLFGQSLFGIILITQAIFSKPRAAAITSSLIYFGFSMFQYFVANEDTKFMNRIWACLSPPVALT